MSATRPLEAQPLTLDTLDARAGDVLRRLLDKNKLTGEERIALQVALMWQPKRALPENVPWPRALVEGMR